MALHRAHFPDLLFDATDRLRGWEERLSALFRAADYRELSPSLVMEPARKDAVLLSDQGTDVGLRWDFTEALAKLLAARFDEPPPRVCYRGAVFRRPENPWEALERFEVGCERISTTGAASGREERAANDQELFGLFMQVPATLGLAHATVRVGSAALLKKPLELEGIDQTRADHLAEFLSKKAPHRVHDALAGHRSQAKLTRHVESLVAGSFETSPYAMELDAEYSELRETEQFLLAAKTGSFGVVEVACDLSDVSGFHFYTGPTVRLWAPHAALELASGGRYDGLYPRLGKAWDAAGFCVRLSRLLELADARPDVFVGQPQPAIGGESS